MRCIRFPSFSGQATHDFLRLIYHAQNVVFGEKAFVFLVVAHGLPVGLVCLLKPGFFGINSIENADQLFCTRYKEFCNSALEIKARGFQGKPKSKRKADPAKGKEITGRVVVRKQNLAGHWLVRRRLDGFDLAVFFRVGEVRNGLHGL